METKETYRETSSSTLDNSLLATNWSVAVVCILLKLEKATPDKAKAIASIPSVIAASTKVNPFLDFILKLYTYGRVC